MTLRGLLTFDENLLKDNIQLPSEIDKNLFCDFLLYECDELEVLIANPAVFADALKKWSTFQLPMWEYYYKIESRQKEMSRYGLREKVNYMSDAGGSSSSSVRLTATPGYSVQSFEIDLSPYENVTSVTVSQPLPVCPEVPDCLFALPQQRRHPCRYV